VLVWAATLVKECLIATRGNGMGNIFLETLF
jgi:hypothetical protein